MMNLNSVVKYARLNTPAVKVINKEGWFRHDIASLLDGTKNIGIELGVARGIYSKRMVESGKFKKFYGVDIYGDILHDTKEYGAALKYVGFENPRYCLLRMDFNSALDLFDDDHFDFIYVDGFAHTGEEGGKTLIDWIKKLKKGGILAGDDYHDDWPLVKWAVNDLVEKLDADLYLTTGVEDNDYSRYPTWYIVKNHADTILETNPDLYKISMGEKKRIHNSRVGLKQKIMRIIGRLLSFFGLKGLALKFLNLLRISND